MDNLSKGWLLRITKLLFLVLLNFVIFLPLCLAQNDVNSSTVVIPVMVKDGKLVVDRESNKYQFSPTNRFRNRAKLSNLTDESIKNSLIDRKSTRLNSSDILF